MKRVVFICIGNACRSQMAEAFARAYGSDVMHAWSAGLFPASAIPRQTIRMMEEKNIPLRDAFPKRLDEVPFDDPDLYINMSGLPVPGAQFVPTRTWNVQDPYQQSDELFREVRDQIEGLVMALVLELRAEARPVQTGQPAPATPAKPPGGPGKRGWRRGL
jgi:arsenate reductase